MLGHGFYNKHSHEQGKANACGLPLITEAINQIDFRQIGDEFRIADYGRRRESGDAEAFAEAYAGFFNAAFEPCLFVSLRETRTQQSGQEVIDSFSEKPRTALAYDPAKYSCRWRLQLMLISKKQK